MVTKTFALKEHVGSRGNEGSSREDGGSNGGSGASGLGGRGSGAGGGRGSTAAGREDLEGTRVGNGRDNNLQGVHLVGVSQSGGDNPVGVALGHTTSTAAVDVADGRKEERAAGVGSVEELDLSLGRGGRDFGVGGNARVEPREGDVIASSVGVAVTDGVGELDEVGGGLSSGDGGNGQSDNGLDEHCEVDVGWGEDGDDDEKGEKRREERKRKRGRKSARGFEFQLRCWIYPHLIRQRPNKVREGCLVPSE